MKIFSQFKVFLEFQKPIAMCIGKLLQAEMSDGETFK